MIALSDFAECEMAAITYGLVGVSRADGVARRRVVVSMILPVAPEARVRLLGLLDEGRGLPVPDGWTRHGLEWVCGPTIDAPGGYVSVSANDEVRR